MGNGVIKEKDAMVYRYSDIVDFELLENGESIVSGGLGRALVGGALFGGVGSIVGGITGSKKSVSICKSLQIKITINDINNPAVYIVFYKDSSNGLRKDDKKYVKLFTSTQECTSILQLICESRQPLDKSTSSDHISSADEILKYKALLDNGAITTEEYEAKKRQILNL